MEKLFQKISVLTSVERVFLFSEYGEVLFQSDQGTHLSSANCFYTIKKAISFINGAKISRFIFENGGFYFFKTSLGYLLICVGPAVSENRLLDGCRKVRMQLEDPESRKRVLLRALTESHQMLKPQIVKTLVSYIDIEVVEDLLSLLEKQIRLNEERDDRLILYICRALGYFPSEKALPLLNDIQVNRGYLKEEILSAVEMAIRQIETDLSNEDNASKREEIARPVPFFQEEPEQEVAENTSVENTNAITDLVEEQKVRECLVRGEREKAKVLLKELITATAQIKRFSDAEKLRDWFMEIDPMALSDSIRTAEIIEHEKTAAIDKEFLAIWTALSEALDLDEFATLYHALEHKKFANGEIFVEQSSPQSALYFINSGRVELFFQENGKDIRVKVLGQGEILGAGTFFESSVWTVTARSLGAEISRLRFDKLQQFQDNFPSLESKLNDFCIRFKISHEPFRRMGRDRRIFNRERIHGRVATVLLDREGKETGVGAKGELFDISAGGISFFLRISQKKNVRLLFGRKIRLVLASMIAKSLNLTGTILAIKSQPVVGNEYSVHVRFDKVLEPDVLRSLIDAGKE